MVYDSDLRYRELCLELASDKIRLIDASLSSITSRAAALKTLPAETLAEASERNLGQSGSG